MLCCLFSRQSRVESRLSSLCLGFWIGHFSFGGEIITSSRDIGVFIDADACPVLKEAIGIATRRGFRVVLIGNDTQNLQRFSDTEGLSVLEVSVGRDAADFAIVTRTNPNDIVVTDDIGLASMVLGKGAVAISSRGRKYDSSKIDFELHFRHVEKKIRRSGGKTKGPSLFTGEDRKRFISVLKKLLDEQSKRKDNK